MMWGEMKFQEANCDEKCEQRTSICVVGHIIYASAKIG
jgi:hypothetical protein